MLLDRWSSVFRWKGGTNCGKYELNGQVVIRKARLRVWYDGINNDDDIKILKRRNVFDVLLREQSNDRADLQQE